MIDHQRTHGIAYRPDVDGLRAVAIMPVVLYHADIAPFGGGFVGVDVFFVISGYLITSFILGEMDRGAFSLRNFYLRRIRRIIPALFLMMAACAVVGWILLTPRDYRSLGESILATALFSSNILFWLQSGTYFAQPLEERPLLHTWSLGVEEQFYLAFPIFLMLLCRFFPRRLIVATLALCILSFGLNVLTTDSHPRLAFYLAPSRVWELFVGALLAMGALTPPRSAIWSEASALLGVALIGSAIFGFSKDTMFPGFGALLPAIGAAAIIWAGIGQDGSVTRLLSHPAPALVGKISYSLYLWHFPLLAFGAYAVVGGLSLAVRFALIGLSIVLAFASWYYIEQPVRRGYWIFGKPNAVFGAAAASLAMFGGFGLAAHFAAGFPDRIGKFGLRIVASERDFNPDRGLCLQVAEDMDRVRPQSCKFGIDDAPPQFALWGDSHAESLRAAVDEAARKARRAGLFFGNAGCIPALGVDRVGALGCSRANEAIIGHLVSMPLIHTVVLAGRWGLAAEGSPYKHEPGKHIYLADASGVPIDNRAALAAGLEATVAKLTAAGKQVWLVGPVPEVGYNVPRALYLYWLGVPQSTDIRPTLNEFKDRQRFVLALLSDIAKKHGLGVVWPHRYLCDASYCAVQKEGRPLYIDDQHLTRFAALSMSMVFDPIFRY